MRLLCHVSHTEIHTKNSMVWTAGRSQGWVLPVLWKMRINCWRLALKEDGTIKKEWRKKGTRTKYMAGPRQHITWTFVRACLRCLTLVDTDVLLSFMYLLLLLLYCCCCFSWCCVTTAVLVHEETEETKKNEANDKYEEKTRTRKYTKMCRKQRKAGNVQHVIRRRCSVELVRGQGCANQSRAGKKKSE